MNAIDPRSDVSVHIWVALARTYHHGWVERLPEGARYDSLRHLTLQMGGTLADVGATPCPSRLHWPEGEGLVHISRTERVRWYVSNTGGHVRLSVRRPIAGSFSTNVIDVDVIDVAGAKRSVLPSTTSILAGGYAGRHVAEIRKLLFALAALPAEKGGITQRHAHVASKMIAAGVSS